MTSYVADDDRAEVDNLARNIHTGLDTDLGVTVGVATVAHAIRRHRSAIGPAHVGHAHTVASIAVDCEHGAATCALLGDVEHGEPVEGESVVARPCEVDGFDGGNLRWRDGVERQRHARAIEPQRVRSGAAVDAEEGQVGDSKDIIARAAAQRVRPATACQRIVASGADQDFRRRSAGGDHGLTEGPTEDHIGLAGPVARVRTTRRTDNQIVETITIDVACRRYRLSSFITVSITLDGEALHRRQVGKVDHLPGKSIHGNRRSKARPRPEDHIGLAGNVAIVRADDQIFVAIAINVTCRRDAGTCIITGRITLDDEALSGRERGQVHDSSTCTIDRAKPGG